MGKARAMKLLLQAFAVVLLAASVFGQETTAGLQGTVKDSTGAVVANAHVVVVGASLTGSSRPTQTEAVIIASLTFPQVVTPLP